MIKKICEYRMLVGLFGETRRWWDSSFLAGSSKAFLAPIYPNTVLTAQYNGVCQAASLIHDEHIGIGLNYHLYRLPGTLERRAAKYLSDEEFSRHLKASLQSPDLALARLKELSGKEIAEAEGPVVVGDYSDRGLPSLLKKALSYYVDAFENDYKTFPYMRCS